MNDDEKCMCCKAREVNGTLRTYDSLTQQLDEAEAEIYRLRELVRDLDTDTHNAKTYAADCRQELNKVRQELLVMDAEFALKSEALASSEQDLKRATTALNKIGLMASGADAYTSKFTTEVQGIVRGWAQGNG